MFNKLLMLFWPSNEMNEIVSGMPARQFGDEYSRVRGSELIQGSSMGFVLIDVRSFCVPPKISLLIPRGTRIPGWKNTGLECSEFAKEGTNNAYRSFSQYCGG
jgi:hypothetical protein